MNGCVIERILAVADSQEACTLLESLFAELSDLQKLLTVGKASVFFAVSDYILGNSRIDAGYIRKK